MKRIFATLCAVVLSCAMLSAQDAVDTIRMDKSDAKRIVVVLNERQDIEVYRSEQPRLRGAEAKSRYMVNVGYKEGYRANVELSAALVKEFAITSSHGYSFGNGLYVGGGAGFMAEFNSGLKAKPTYLVPLFADVKYSFMNDMATPFVSLKGGAMADITNTGARTFAEPAVGVDIARFSLMLSYEYQLGFWGDRNGEHIHRVKIGVGYTF